MKKAYIVKDLITEKYLFYNSQSDISEFAKDFNPQKILFIEEATLATKIANKKVAQMMVEKIMGGLYTILPVYMPSL